MERQLLTHSLVDLYTKACCFSLLSLRNISQPLIVRCSSTIVTFLSGLLWGQGFKYGSTVVDPHFDVRLTFSSLLYQGVL